MNEIRLSGCTPEPLSGYLKALGIFRLIVEQKDPAARLNWERGCAVIESSMDREGLVQFFISEYRPTPILAPWNGGGGFHDETAGILDVIREISSTRLEPVRKAIAATEQIVGPMSVARRRLKTLEAEKKKLRKADASLDEGLKEQKRLVDRLKARLQIETRQLWPDEQLAWFDAVVVLDNQSEPSYLPLLGSGGNDGRLDFTNNYMQRLVEIIPPDGQPSAVPNIQRLLEAALFADALARLGSGAVGQFNPGGVGGANAIQGRFEADSRVNPWEYVFMLEGSLLFAGAASRRLGSRQGGRSAFPFTVDSVAAGYGTAAPVEETSDGSRAEMWLPLWDARCGLAEVKQLFAEGRAQLGRRQARNAVEFALAACLLGVSRGIRSFARYGFLKRNGLAFLAAPLGRFEVASAPNARLLSDPPLLDWVEKLRRACSDKDRTPSRYQSALRDTDREVMAFASKTHGANAGAGLLSVLTSLGRAERTLARGLAFCAEKFIRPLQSLSPDWLTQADDGSAEFRLAASLAGIRGVTRKRVRVVGPMRECLEEVAVTKFTAWAPGSTSAVWTNRPLADNLAAVFARRQMEAFRAGLEGVPISCARPARLADVIRFLRGEVDDERIARLLWGLIAVDWPAEQRRIQKLADARRGVPRNTVVGEKRPRKSVRVPFEFGVPRLLVGTNRFVPLAPGSEFWEIAREGGPNAVADPEVFHPLASGRPDAVSACVDRAARRLKSGGLLVTGYRNRRLAGRGLGVRSPFPATRLLAAMLFPLARRDLARIAGSVLSPSESKEN